VEDHQSHDNVRVSSTIYNLRIIYHHWDSNEEAIKDYNQTLKMKEDMGDKSVVARTLHQIGRINEEKRGKGGRYSVALRN
jgi:hypothetical protein